MVSFKSVDPVIFACVIAFASFVHAESNRQNIPDRFSFAGRVVDEQGRPISDVKVSASYSVLGVEGTGYIDQVTSDAAGNFTIDRERGMSGAHAADMGNNVIRLQFIHPEFRRAELEDMHSFSHEAATHLVITLHAGRMVQGNVIDAAGTAVAGAGVEITFGSAWAERRATVTDAKGHFKLNGLPAEAGTIHVLTTATHLPAMTGQKEVEARATQVGNIALSEIQLPPGTVVHKLFGMKLVDVDAAIQKSFHYSRPDGVLILEPGSKSEELHIGPLQRGDVFWMVGDKTVKTTAEFEKDLLEQRQSLSAIMGCRVVYNFNRPDFSGSNTQYMQISKGQLGELEQAVK